MADGINVSGLEAYMQKLKRAGHNVGEIANAALEAAGEPGKEAFASELPYDMAEKDPYHAQENVNISPIQGVKAGKRYRIIGVFTNDGAKRDWSKAQYLFYVEHGTSKMPAYPFLHDAWAAVDEVCLPIMEQTAIEEIKKRFG